jgi:hypothetical protein
MLRGHRTAYLSLFDEPENLTPTPLQMRGARGRSEQMIEKRNELLAHRHYYYIKIERRQYQDTLNILENEFFLCQRTIVDVFQRNDILKYLNAKKPEKKYFKEKYPWMMW